MSLSCAPPLHFLSPPPTSQVLVCSDCAQSKALLLQLAHRLGFTPVDFGVLSASRHVEEVPLLLFPSWGGPILTTFLLFLFFYGYIFLRNILLPFIDKGQNNFYKLPFEAVHETLAVVALVTLALVYLPGNSSSSLLLQSLGSSSHPTTV